MEELNKMRRKLFKSMGFKGGPNELPFSKEELEWAAKLIPDKDILLRAFKKQKKRKHGRG